ncbi:MAG: transcription-repair coupling factor [Phycisphaerae bacterium]|nr:transcription-repair coupling factor [Phycisphaerae bacterium]
MSEILKLLEKSLLGYGSVFQSVIDEFKPVDKRKEIEVSDSWGSLDRVLAALISKQTRRDILFITGHIPEADRSEDDLETLMRRPIDILPASESADGVIDPASEIACQRLKLCRELLFGHKKDQPRMMVASISALMQPVPDKKSQEKNSFNLAQGSSKIPLDQLIEILADHSYNRVDPVDMVGDFAVRGGIIDIFAPTHDYPIRVEYFGDEIDSVRYFDLDTQRSITKLQQITITGLVSTGIEQSCYFTDYLAKDCLIIIEDFIELSEVGKITRDRMIRPEAVYPVEEILKQINNFDTLFINRFNSGIIDKHYSLNSKTIGRYENRSTEALGEFSDLAEHEDATIMFFCETDAQRQRMIELVESDIRSMDKPVGAMRKVKPDKIRQIPDNLLLEIGVLHRGFDLPDFNLLMVGHHEIFGQHQISRRIRKTKNVQAIESFTDLENNDLVVHVTHGIGKFLGMKLLEKHGRKEEYLHIEYADSASIYVPANKIDLVHKYVGAGARGDAKLSKLGSKSWYKQKEKVNQAIEDLASELVDLQAYRASMPGIEFPPDTKWQIDFEQAFPYQPTEDQNSVNIEIKKDMQRRIPMDRLLCGDVGFGKTELAMRAAFKSAEFGKQVAILAPTTILAEQHHRSFMERMADFPLCIEVINRFTTGKKARGIVEATKAGQVDILIGTHRILSDDIEFKDLGLVIIDEEQRFGVGHKEKLKQVRKTVDVLTLSATPLPRSMHMALLGIRDISSLTTPPMDRRSIVTEVCKFDERRIKQIILNELNRDGQVYFLHNRVHDIETFSDRIRKLVPDARIVVAHGQMPKSKLEKQMLDFIRHKADVLISTTIIESGIDIPNANTLIVHDADRFGLSQLHQLRGRVGRYKNRAYAYMLLPEKRKINPEALKRLKTIEEYSQLGCGFRIALRDLEIRGAGNILGTEQSGHIDAIGYEMYCRLLASAVRRIKDEPEPFVALTHLELNISNNIPRSYIASQRQRMDAYRRMVTCQNAADLDLLEKDLLDLFGKPPKPVTDLLQMAEIRILATPLKIRSIVQKEPDLIFELEKGARFEDIFANSPGSVRVPDKHTVHVRLGKRYFETTSTLMATLRNMLKKLQEN